MTKQLKREIASVRQRAEERADRFMGHYDFVARHVVWLTIEECGRGFAIKSEETFIKENNL